jgi:hypothetical protein
MIFRRFQQLKEFPELFLIQNSFYCVSTASCWRQQSTAPGAGQT